MRLTVKERILLHLLDSARSADAVEVTPAVTQAGLAGGAGIQLRHLAQFLRPLLRDGLVRERTAHVAGKRQRMKAYALTMPGRAAAIRLREKVGAPVVQVGHAGSVRSPRPRKEPPGRLPTADLVEAVQQAQPIGTPQLASVRHAPEPGLVQQLWDAPQVGTFVGRGAELAELTREDDGARVFVIRGMAGIGKSTLAARACDMVRDRRNIFWHRIRPWDSDLSLLAGIGRFLEALDRPGLSAVLKRSEPALAAEVLRQDLPDTHSLLVFDDAHDASSPILTVIRMLMEAVASSLDVKMLILTRRALRLSGVREIELDGLKPEDAASLLIEGGDSAALAGLGRRLAGHPLLIELIRSQRSDLPRAMRDVHRFIEEEVYRELSDGERIVMKAASLYRVPVPRATLLAIPGSAFESLLALQDRSLLQFVGDERYEMHDMVREFFEGILTKEERHRYGTLAVSELRGLAAEAFSSGDALLSVACLSNALRIAEPPEDLPSLYESLGDANHRIGDALAMSTAYRSAMLGDRGPETMARLHRKMAAAFEEWGQYNTAAAEMDAGLSALGDADSVERGWLELIRARMLLGNVGEEEAWGHAETARDVFHRSRVPQGEAEAMLELGASAALAGRLAPDGTLAFERCFESGLELASSVPDPILEARIHLNAAAVIGHGLGHFEDCWGHFRAVEASSAAMADPVIRGTFHLTRAWVLIVVLGDYAGGDSDLVEAVRVARRIHDAKVLGNALYLRSIPARHDGRDAEAARYLREAGREMESAGLTSFAYESYAIASVHCLLARDWESYREIEGLLHSPQLAAARESEDFRWLQHHALDALIQGDLGAFDRHFNEFFRRAKESPASSYAKTGVWWGHFFYAVGLRALGRQAEAEDHLHQAEVLLHAFGNRMGQDLVNSDFGERLTRALRDAKPAMAMSAA